MKREFLERLRAALYGKVTSDVLKETLQYYEEYISSETRMGRDEEEVVYSLGDPRLLARTIIETNPMKQNDAYDEEVSDGEYGPRNTNVWNNSTGVPMWFWGVAILLLIIVIIGVVFSILIKLLPILIPILIVLYVLKMFKDRF